MKAEETPVCSLSPQGGPTRGCASDFKLMTVSELKDVVGTAIAEISFSRLEKLVLRPHSSYDLNQR